MPHLGRCHTKQVPYQFSCEMEVGIKKSSGTDVYGVGYIILLDCRRVRSHSSEPFTTLSDTVSYPVTTPLLPPHKKSFRE